MINNLLTKYYLSSGTYYFSSDQINSTRMITDSSGSVVYSAMFDPYGGMQKKWVNTYQPSIRTGTMQTRVHPFFVRGKHDMVDK